MKEIKAGDVVCIKSDTRGLMTVTSIEGEYARIIRHNSVTNSLERDKIEVVALLLVK